MAYYIWKLKGKIVAYKNTDDYCPPPAIKITEENARELGIYHGTYISGGGSSDASSISPAMAAFMDGINAV